MSDEFRTVHPNFYDGTSRPPARKSILCLMAEMRTQRGCSLRKDDAPMNLLILQTLVKEVLRSAIAHPQNFKLKRGTTGVFTVTLTDEVAINIFDHAMAIEGCADFHSHWYDFKSTILAGELRHVRYAITERPTGATPIAAEGLRANLQHQAIRREPNCWLMPFGVEEIRFPDVSYIIESNEIHSVEATKGAVTIVEQLHITKPDGYWIFKKKNPAPRKFHNEPVDPAYFLQLGLDSLGEIVK